MNADSAYYVHRMSDSELQMWVGVGGEVPVGLLWRVDRAVRRDNRRRNEWPRKLTRRGVSVEECRGIWNNVE